MKLEDIKDQDALDAAITTAVETAVAGLAAKNQEILGKLAKAKEVPDDLDALKKAATDLAALKASQLEEQGNYKKLLENSTAQHKEAIDKLNNDLKATNDELTGMLVQGGLSKLLSAGKVNPVLLEAAVGLLASDVSVISADGKRTAQVGDKTLDVYVADWLQSEVGKNFVLADGNTGGGANGNSGGTNGDEAAKLFTTEGWNLTAQARLSVTDPEKYKALHEQHPVKPEQAAS